MLKQEMVISMQDLQSVIALLEEAAQDRAVPKNVKNNVIKAKEDLANDRLDLEFRVSSAISILDEVANDINLPPYTRTQIWTAVSTLETINAQFKKENAQ